MFPFAKRGLHDSGWGLHQLMGVKVSRKEYNYMSIYQNVSKFLHRVHELTSHRLLSRFVEQDLYFLPDTLYPRCYQGEVVACLWNYHTITIPWACLAESWHYSTQSPRLGHITNDFSPSQLQYHLMVIWTLVSREETSNSLQLDFPVSYIQSVFCLQ